MNILKTIYDNRDYPKIFKDFTDKDTNQFNVSDSKNHNENNEKENKQKTPNQILTEILKMNFEIKDKSSFFEEYISSYPFNKETSREILSEMEKGYIHKLKNHELFLFWFPNHFFKNQKIFEILLSPTKGFLPITWKYYLGIMASSTMKCEYLFKNLEEEFLLNGGDENWLIKGMEILPEKLQKIGKVNNILAHQPWKLNENDIEVFVKNSTINTSKISNISNSLNSGDSFSNTIWNKNEIVEAVLILINFYRLASIMESIKLRIISPQNFIKSKGFENHEGNNENENEGKLSFENFDIFSLKDNTSIDLNENDKEKKEFENNYIIGDLNEDKAHKENLINVLGNLNTEEEKENNNIEINKLENIYNENEKEIKNNNSNKNSNMSNFNNNNNKKSNDNKQKIIENILTNDDFAKHISNYCTVYLDFDRHSQVFHSCLEFNWEDHAFHILQNYQPEAINAINDEIETIISMTSNK